MPKKMTTVKEMTAFVVTHLVLEGNDVDFDIISDEKSVIKFSYENGTTNRVYIELKDDNFEFYNDEGEKTTLEV